MENSTSSPKSGVLRSFTRCPNMTRLNLKLWVWQHWWKMTLWKCLKGIGETWKIRYKACFLRLGPQRKLIRQKWSKTLEGNSKPSLQKRQSLNPPWCQLHLSNQQLMMIRHSLCIAKKKKSSKPACSHLRFQTPAFCSWRDRLRSFSSLWSYSKYMAFNPSSLRS